MAGSLSLTRSVPIWRATNLLILSLFVSEIECAVRCASTRPSAVGFVYDEDVQLMAIAANSPDALPGRRVPENYRPPRPYQSEERPPYADRAADYFKGRNRQNRNYPDDRDSRRSLPEVDGRDNDYYDRNSRRNGTGGMYPADSRSDRISNQDRYLNRIRNESYYGEDGDSWNQIADEPYARRYPPLQRNESRQSPYNDVSVTEYGRPRPSQYSVGDEDEAAEDSRLLQLLVKREKERLQQKGNSTASKPTAAATDRRRAPPSDRYDRDDVPDRKDRRRPAFSDNSYSSERYRGRDYDDDDDESCPIETRETKSHQTDFPLSAVSAILSVPIGDFILYATEAPGKAIISYHLNCEGPDARGNEPLYTATANSCFHLLVVDDLLNMERPSPVVICLSRGAFSTAFRVDYDQNQFRLQPCLQIIEHKYLTDVATIAAGKAGALVAFSNNDLRPEAEYHETIAPIYLARGGQLLLCGYVDVQHTTDVALWHVRGKEYVVAYIEKRPGSRRSLLHFFEIIIKNGRCHSISPKRDQPMIGGEHYRGQSNTLCASEPFTISHAICGAEDIQFLTSHDKYYHPSTHLAIAIANDAFEEGRIGCPDQELVCPDNKRDKCFCSCPHANHRSFVIEFNPQNGIFDFSSHQKHAFQELNAGPESVTEITHLPTEKCCMVFQTISPLGATELYTIENDGRGYMRVYQFFDSGLPHFAEKSAFGYCSPNDLILSYTLHSFQTDNTIYHLQCNKDRRSEWVDRPYGGYNSGRNRDNRDQEPDRQYRTAANRYRGDSDYRNRDIYPDRNNDARYVPYGNVSSSYPSGRRPSYDIPINNSRTAYRDTGPENYKYRPRSLAPSQSSALPYGRPRISAVLPDMDFGGNYSFDGALANYPINPQVSQQYNRPNLYPSYAQSNRSAPSQPGRNNNYPRSESGPYRPASRNNSTQVAYRPNPAPYNQLIQPPPPPPPPPTIPSQPLPPIYGYIDNPTSQYGSLQPPGPPPYQDNTNFRPQQQQSYQQGPPVPPIGGWPISYSSRYDRVDER